MQNITKTAGAGETAIVASDVIIECDTNDGGAVDLVLPSVADYLAAKDGKDFGNLGFSLADIAANAAANNITVAIEPASGDLINNAASVVLAVSGTSAIIKPAANGHWILVIAG